MIRRDKTAPGYPWPMRNHSVPGRRALARTMAACAAVVATVSTVSIVSAPAGADPRATTVPGLGEQATAPAAQLQQGSQVTVDPGATIIATRDGQQTLCTLSYLAVTRQDAAAVSDPGKRQPLGLTAGHCGSPGSPVSIDGVQVGTVTARTSPKALPNGIIVGDQIKAPDWAVITLDRRSGAKFSPAAGNDFSPVRYDLARPGDTVCTRGARSGAACGHVLAVADDWISTDIKRTEGDSGGPLYRAADRAALGTLGHVSTDGRSFYYALAPVLTANGINLAIAAAPSTAD